MTSTYQFLSAIPKTEFKDFDLNFGINPVSGDLLSKNTEESIKQAIKTIVLTNFYERPFNPTLGGQITGALFEIYTIELEIFLRKELGVLIQSFEPRISLKEIYVGYNQENDEIRARIEYVVIGQVNVSSLDLIFERVR